MRFVRLRPGCVAGLGDMMRERERDVVTLELTLGHNLGRAGTGPPLQPMYCVLCPVSEVGDEGGDEDERHPGVRGRG